MWEKDHHEERTPRETATTKAKAKAKAKVRIKGKGKGKAKVRIKGINKGKREEMRVRFICSTHDAVPNIRYISVYDHEWIIEFLTRMGRMDIVRKLGTRDDYAALARLFKYKTGKNLMRALDMFKIQLYWEKI